MSAALLAAAPALRQTWLATPGRRAQLVEIGTGPARLIWFPALLDRAATFTRAGIALGSTLHGQVTINAIDPPGYGASGAAIGVDLPEFGVLQDWVNQALDELPAGPKLLVGNSSGAVSALAASQRPDVVGIALVGWCDWRLVGPPPVDTLCPIDPAGLDRLLALGWHRRPAIPEPVLTSLLGTTRSSSFRRHVESFDRDQFGRHLDAYRGPLALICGTSDGVTTPAMVSRLAASRPESELRWIPSCGHYPHREAPLALAKILARWAVRILDDVNQSTMNSTGVSQ